MQCNTVGCPVELCEGSAAYCHHCHQREVEEAYQRGLEEAIKIARDKGKLVTWLDFAFITPHEVYERACNEVARQILYSLRRKLPPEDCDCTNKAEACAACKALSPLLEETF